MILNVHSSETVDDAFHEKLHDHRGRNDCAPDAMSDDRDIICNSLEYSTMDEDKCTALELDQADALKVKAYDVGVFQTDIIGSRRNIYVDKKFVNNWIIKISEIFKDESMMYYWLDYIITLQIINKSAKIYVNTEDNEFIVALIDCKLHNKQHQSLYGVILLNKEANEECNDGQFPYKLVSLMTKEEIKRQFGINETDVPAYKSKMVVINHPILLVLIRYSNSNTSTIRACGSSNIFRAEYSSMNKRLRLGETRNSLGITHPSFHHPSSAFMVMDKYRSDHGNQQQNNLFVHNQASKRISRRFLYDTFKQFCNVQFDIFKEHFLQILLEGIQGLHTTELMMVDRTLTIVTTNVENHKNAMQLQLRIAMLALDLPSDILLLIQQFCAEWYLRINGHNEWHLMTNIDDNWYLINAILPKIINKLAINCNENEMKKCFYKYQWRCSFFMTETLTNRRIFCGAMRKINVRWGPASNMFQTLSNHIECYL